MSETRLTESPTLSVDQKVGISRSAVFDILSVYPRVGISQSAS